MVLIYSTLEDTMLANNNQHRVVMSFGELKTLLHVQHMEYKKLVWNLAEIYHSNLTLRCM